MKHRAVWSSSTWVARTRNSTLEALLAQANRYAEAHCMQPSLFAEEMAPPAPVDMRQASVIGVTHQFARSALLASRLRHSENVSV